MSEQKCTIKDLIDELNKVVKSYGYLKVKEITLALIHGEEVNYKD